MNYHINFLGGIGSNGFYIKWIFGTQDSQKKIMEAVLELLAKQHCPILPIYQEIGQKWAELATRILIFSTAMGAKPSFYMKFVVT